MKKIIISLILIIFFAGCTVQVSDTTTDTTTSTSPSSTENSQDTGLSETSSSLSLNPVSTFTQEDIEYLGVNCSGTDAEIAECIYDWQSENMIYLGLTQTNETYVNSADSIHWNYALPGIFPTNRVIRQRTYEGKVYGVCYDYATIYCSIAQYYGLDCRVANSITKPSERPNSEVEFTTGLQYKEFERMQVELDYQELDYNFILMNKVLRETPEHFWSEVKIDDEWIIMDASNTLVEDRYKSVNDWEISDWESFYEETNIDYYLNQFDDLNNRVKLFDIGDYQFSQEHNLGLTVPYYESCNNVCNFFKDSLNFDCINDCESYKNDYSCYENCKDEQFYIICDYVCGNIEDVNDFANCYYKCSGRNLDLTCDSQCLND